MVLSHNCILEKSRKFHFWNILDFKNMDDVISSCGVSKDWKFQYEFRYDKILIDNYIVISDLRNLKFTIKDIYDKG